MPILGAVVKRAMQLNKKMNEQRHAPIHYQEKTLKKLLKKAANSEFGQHYKFNEIIKSYDVVEAFQNQVPIFDYNRMYDEWWHRTLQSEVNVSWPGKIKYFALSSGTTGSPSKYIPVTKDMLRSMRRAGVRMFYNTTQFNFDTAFYEKHMMMFGGSTNLQQGNGFQAGDLSGINTGRLPMWVRHFYKPGTKISGLNDWNERIQRIAEEAPKWDIGIVAGIPSWIQLMMERVIEHNNLDNIHEVWPNFQVYVSGGVAFEPYKNGFKKLLGKEIHYMDTYLASEGFIAMQSRLDEPGMGLITDNGLFYEFIPFNEENFNAEGELIANPDVLTIDEVVPNQDYALILTSCSGTWRYFIGDTVRFTDVKHGEIIITGRTKHFLSICGEHLSVGNMNEAIQLVEQELNITIREFTVSGIELDNGKFAHKWYIGCEPYVPADQLEKILDNKLRQVNDDYSTERDSVLGMKVETLSPHVFYEWYESKGKMGGQNKIPRVMKKDIFEEWEAFVKQTAEG
jgi:phenylacetate-coenzyme A ligase PaaK-like adenylate-forming protein